MNDPRIAAAAAATDEHAPFQRLFLTGGSGFVGRNIIRHFAGKGIDVVALVRSDRSTECVRALGAMPYRGDVLDPGIMAGMAGCDALIHAAADTGHGLGTTMQKRVNEDGTRVVMAAAQSAGIRKAIHISTESVLATGMPLVGVREDMPLPQKFAGSYSRSKAAAERNALASNTPEFAVVVLRPRFVWGRDDTTALPALLEAARSGKLAWIAGGAYLTSTTHIANLCMAVELALSSGRGGEIYFISDGAPVEFRTFVSALLKTQGVPAPDKSLPRPLVRTIATIGEILGAISNGSIVPPLTLQAYATSAVEVTLDIGKARRELNYEPTMSLEDGLEELRSDQQWKRVAGPSRLG